MKELLNEQFNLLRVTTKMNDNNFITLELAPPTCVINETIKEGICTGISIEIIKVFIYLFIYLFVYLFVYSYQLVRFY